MVSSSALCLSRKASAVGKVSLACRSLLMLACLTRECALSPGERLTASRLNVIGLLKKPSEKGVRGPIHSYT